MEEIKSRFSGPEHSPGYQLWRVTLLWQQRMRAALAPHGLTHVQFVLLAVTSWLTRGDVDTLVTQIQVAEAAGTDEMMTSQVLRTLEKNGLIRREPHPTDARAKRLVVTDAGRSITAAAMVSVETADVRFFEAVADVDTLTSTLRGLVERHGTGEKL